MSAHRLAGPWSYREGLGVLVTFVVAYVALSAAHMLTIKYSVGFEKYVGHGPRLPPALLIVNQALKALCLLGAVAWVGLRRQGLDWRAVGFVTCAQRWYFIAPLITLAGFALRLLLAKLLVVGLPDWARHAASPYAWGDAAWPQTIVLLVMTVVVTPIAEEVFFRGFLFQWMASHRPLWLAILASSAMFGASHIVPAQAISAALMSVLIIALYLGSRSIWPCIVCHAFNNALGVGLGMAAAAGELPAWLTPPATG